MKSEKKILLTDVNQYITCVLCKGYLIDATTITECLHTFCKKCIVQYLEENTNCPICDTLLHQSHPLLYIAHDRTLQSIVYKLVANLEKDELERQVKFYDEQKLDYPQQLKEKLDQFNLFINKHQNHHEKENNSTQNASNNENANNGIGNSQQSSTDKLTASNTGASQSSGNKLATINLNLKNNNNFHRDDEQIAVSLEPLEGLKSLEKKFILCSCHSTITHLKKYVALKIFSNLELYKELDIVCDDEILGKDHTLKFILVTKWKDKEMPMRLNFRPKLVF